MIAGPLAILSASLIGSVHCAAMCGGFVCAYTSSGSEPVAVPAAAASKAPSSPVVNHAMYNAGRLLAYATLGAAAGLLGAHVTQVGALGGFASGATILSGTLLILWAIHTLAGQSGVHLGKARTPQSWQRAIGWLLLKIRKQPVSVRAFATGLLTGALPCGWLYVFVTTAGGTGSVTAGVATMSLFWLGTLPAMVAVGIGAQRWLVPLRDRLPKLSAVIVLATGILTLSGRLVFTHVH